MKRDPLASVLTVLDIDCNGGFYSLEMKRRGASQVLGIDSNPRYLEQARLASQVTGLPLNLRCMSVYDLGGLDQTFDIVLFMGVLYHLRYPLLALDLLRNTVVGDLMVFQAMQRGHTEVELAPVRKPCCAARGFRSSTTRG